LRAVRLRAARMREPSRTQPPATRKQNVPPFGAARQGILCWRRNVSTRRRACFAGSFTFLFEHDLLGKPVSTFPDHAPAAFLHCDKRQSVHFRCGGKHALQCLDVGTCGRLAADSCARVTPYCSVWAVGYDISCGSSDPLESMCSAYTFGRDFRARRGLRDSDRRDFGDLASPALPPVGPREAKGRIR